MRKTWWTALAGVLALTAVAVGYTLHAGGAAPAAGGSAVTLEGPGSVLYRSKSGTVAARAATGATTVSGLTCARFAAGGGTAVCLVPATSIPPTTDVVILDRRLREVKRIHVPGIATRARVSASGRMVAWTTFVTGDSYATAGFSTATGLLDTRTDHLVTNIENLQVYVDGARYHSPDVNFWGVTFGADDNLFYATLSTRGRTYLIRGDVGNWRAETVRENVECPSLSPDGTRIAFKKRVGEAWRLTVLDLATLAETPLAEAADVDDQAAWLTAGTVAYARAGSVWTVPADGTGTPTVLLPDASSPAPLTANA